MKNFMLLLLVLSSFNLLAETTNPFAGIQTEGMQTMMLNMQAIQNCMAKINQDELMAIGQQAKTVQENIQKECSAAKPNNAQKIAMDFVKELEKSSAVKQAQACLKDLPDMMKGHIPGADIQSLQSELENKDICSSQLSSQP